MFKHVTVKVDLMISPTDEELTKARQAYEPTAESPEPDEDWLAEEVAMKRLEQVKGVVQLTCTDEEVS